MVQTYCVVAATAAIAVILQGCGGDGGGPTPSPPPAANTTTPAPPPAPWTPGTAPACMKDKSCTPPKDGADMATYLSTNYNAFDASTMKGDSLGVYITMQDGTKGHADLHHYCAALTGKGSCYKGRADCILSVALYNRHVMLDGDKQGAHLKVFAGRSAGYVINTTLAERRYNKCAYIFDGATSFKYNQGCGRAATGAQDCKNKDAAFYNKCPSSGKTCKISDPEIQPDTNCESIIKPGTHHRKWPNTTGETPCYFTGPSFAYPTVDEKYNKINLMVENRIYNQNPNPGDCSNPLDRCPGIQPAGEGGACCPVWKHGVETKCASKHTDCNRLSKWNEVVMDLRPMIEDLKADPNTVIPAFVYAKGHKAEAENLRKKFKETYAPIGDAPLILMDQTKDVTQQKKFGPPFVFEAADATITI